jgi:hypothetical protein
MQKNRQEVLRTQHLAVCRVNLDVTTSVFQVGSNITDRSKMHLIVSGLKDNKRISVALTVDYKGHISCEQISSLDGVQVNKGVSHEGKALI